MRTRDEILEEKARFKAMMVKVVDEAVEIDELCDAKTAAYKKELKCLDAEQCYEDTLDGKIEVAEEKVVMEINTILDELTRQTGITYPRILRLERRR